MLGGLAMKWRWRAKMEKAGKPTGKPNLVTGPVQICWHKFARYWDIEIREIPMEHDRYYSSPESVLKYCDENTIGVVATLGTTFTLNFEPVAEIAKALDQFQKKTGIDNPRRSGRCRQVRTSFRGRHASARRPSCINTRPCCAR